ncbi:MAG: 50S ribosome-binding GTPase [Actinomycetaceae bacterium]|nr:50S ribosome-binding GTPase [Actinomycetaceae bacterium]
MSREFFSVTYIIVSSEYNARALADLVTRTLTTLDTVRLPLDMAGARELKEIQAQLVTQLKTRILPHLLVQTLPAVVVLGGSSGAGKSTLFNTIIGEEVSPASVLRPTTRTPYIAVHPQDKAAMAGHSLLSMGNVVYPENSIPGLVIVDAPDLDSVDAKNRELARRLLDAADIWLFVTTSARYGDALAWEMLCDAHARGITSTVVLNRTPQDVVPTVRADLMKRMAEENMGDTPLIVVPDAGPQEGLLGENSVGELRLWLSQIASSQLASTLVDRATRAMLPELKGKISMLAEAVEMQANVVEELEEKVNDAVIEPLSKVVGNAKKGRYGQGSPTTSWLTLASTGGALSSLSANVKPSLLRRRQKGERDVAMISVFDGVLTAVRVGLTQALVAGEDAICSAWRESVVDAESFIKKARERLNVDTIVNEAEMQWKRDLKLMAGAVPDNPWLMQSGIAAMIGVGAGGVHGVVSSLRHISADDLVQPAREKLAGVAEDAMTQLCSAYISVLKEIPVGDGKQLRLRAAEYNDYV